MRKRIVLEDINCLLCKYSLEKTMEYVPWFDDFTYSFTCINCGVPGPYGDINTITDIYFNADTKTCWLDGSCIVTAITCKNFRPKVKPNA